jgi:hypothetical protein
MPFMYHVWLLPMINLDYADEESEDDDDGAKEGQLPFVFDVLNASR